MLTATSAEAPEAKGAPSMTHDASEHHRAAVHRELPGPRLPGLDNLRAIAALAIAYHHTQQVEYLYGLPNRWEQPAVLFLGGAGVTLFFVLSGFLITFLLCRELSTFGRINVPAFVRRRALRILPLYYLVFIAGFLILPKSLAFDVPGFINIWSCSQFLLIFLLFMFISPQLTPQIRPAPFIYAGPLWSIGTEEYFYAVWQFVIAWSKSYLVPFCGVVVVGFSAARFVALDDTNSWFSHLLEFMRFDCMAIGAVDGYLAHHSTSSARCDVALRIVTSNLAQLVSFSAFLIRFAIGKQFGFLSVPIYSIIFLVLIINAALNSQRCIIQLNGRVLEYIGRISYGLYLYNWFSIVACLLIVRLVFWFASKHAQANIITVMGIALSVGMAAVSYRFVETPFLRLKERSKARERAPVSMSVPVLRRGG